MGSVSTYEVEAQVRLLSNILSIFCQLFGVILNLRVKDGAGTDVTMFKCNYCDYQSLQKSHMRCHERAIHKQVCNLFQATDGYYEI